MSASLEERAAALRRLASLSEREVPLAEALEALSGVAPSARRASYRAAAQRAREGAPVEQVLEQAGLMGDGDRALIAAARERPALGLRLLGDELHGRAELRELLRVALARPLWKLVGLFLLSLSLGTVLRLLVVDVAVAPSHAIRPEAAEMVFAILASAVLAPLTFVGGLWALTRTAPGRRTLLLVSEDLPLVATFLRLEGQARFLRVLGTALAAGLPLAEALARVQAAFGMRSPGRRLGELVARAREGASLSELVREASVLDRTTRWLVEEAAARPDLPGELLALAQLRQERLRTEVARWSPFLSGLAELGTGLLLGALVLGLGAAGESMRGLFF